MIDLSDLTTLLFGVALILLLLVVLAFRQAVSLRLDRRAIRDPETGIFAADFIQEVYQSELRRAERTGVPFSVALVTVRPANDGGRKAAPSGVISIARRLQQQLRGSDFVGRLQNNHFVVILPETWEEDARQVAARIRAAFGADSRGGPALTCEIGMSTWRPEQTDVWTIAQSQLSQVAATARSG